MNIDANSTGREIEQEMLRNAVHLIGQLEAEVERANAVADSMEHFAAVADCVERRNNELHAERDAALAEVERLRHDISALHMRIVAHCEERDKAVAERDRLAKVVAAVEAQVEYAERHGKAFIRSIHLRQILTPNHPSLAAADAPQPEKTPPRCRCGGIPPNHHPRCDPSAPEVQGPPSPPWPPPPGRMHG